MADEFGPLLRMYRGKASLSQGQVLNQLREVAHEERYSRADISKWEHGRIPPEAVVEDLEEILSTPTGILLRAAGYQSAAGYRRFLEAGSGPSQEERQEFLTLLQRWRGQVQFLSVDQLLRKSYFENWRTDLERKVAETEEVSQAYLDVLGRHWETIPKPYKATLPVESESLFERLKDSYPDAEVWQAQELWGQAYGIYWDAFGLWLAEVNYFTELALGVALKEVASEDLDNNVANAQRLIKKVKRAKPDAWLFHRLLALVVACDLWVLGIREQSPHAFWALEVEKIGKLRHAIVLASMKELPQDFWLTGANRVYAAAKSLWDNYQPVNEKTMALLKALDRLQRAQNDVHNKLKKLELSLSRYASIPTSRKT